MNSLCTVNEIVKLLGSPRCDLTHLHRVETALRLLRDVPAQYCVVHTADPCLTLFLLTKFDMVVYFWDGLSFPYFYKYRDILMKLHINPSNLRVIRSNRLVINVQTRLVDWAFQDNDTIDLGSAVATGGFLIQGSGPYCHSDFVGVNPFVEREMDYSPFRCLSQKACIDKSDWSLWGL